MSLQTVKTTSVEDDLANRSLFAGGWNAHAEHTAAIREKAEVLVAKLETACWECGCKYEFHGRDPDDLAADGWCENCVAGCLGFLPSHFSNGKT